MKKLQLSIAAFLLLIFACSKEEEAPAPPPTPTYKLSFSVDDGGTVSTEGGTYNQGSKITVTATPDGQYLFKEWSDGSTVNPREITVNADLTLKATFVKKTYPLSVTIDGEGTVQEQVIIQGSTTETEYNAGTTVRLTATANEGWGFSLWVVDGEVIAENPTEVAIEKGREATVFFKRTQFDLNITIEGEGTVKEEVIVQPSQYDFETVVRLTAVPADGWEFSGWSGDVTSEENPIEVQFLANYALVAKFEKLQLYTLTLSAEGNGSVEIKDTNDNDVINGSQIKKGEKLFITAKPEEGFEFIKWSNGSYKNPDEVIVESDSTLSASFISKRPNLQGGIDRSIKNFESVAVILVDFPDVPEEKRVNFASEEEISAMLNGGFVTDFLSSISYGKFSYQVDVYDKIMYPKNSKDASGNYISQDELKTANYTVPGLDSSKYDRIALVFMHHEYGMVWPMVVYPNFKVNGLPVPERDHFALNIIDGDLPGDPRFFLNNLEKVNLNCVTIADNNFVSCFEGNSKLPYSQFERIWLHEYIHVLGVMTHANSSTNGNSLDFEPEESDNKANGKSLLNQEYGNFYDVMGTSLYSMSLNSVFRDYLGWHNPNNRLTIKEYGSHTITLHDLNSSDKSAFVEIRIPNKVNNPFPWRKNQGYFIELRSSKAAWDKMLDHIELKENKNGVMLLKTDGFSSHLVDASPSKNFIATAGTKMSDIRDVVLKPGMVYENDEIKLHNVIANSDGSYTLDVVVK